MKHKKLWMAGLSLSALFCALFALTACGHKHKWEDPIFTEATCTEEGSVESRCKTCGYVTKEYSLWLGHDMVDGVCSRCGYNEHPQLEYDYIGGGYAVTGIGEWVDEEIIIPSTYINDPVIAIADLAFFANKKITSVEIPESVTSIGKSAFNHCENLSKIVLPDSVTFIGEEAFANTAYFGKGSNWEKDVLYIGNHLIRAKETITGSYIVRKGCLTIASGAFRNCVDLRGIKIGDDVTIIQDNAFYNALYNVNLSFYTSIVEKEFVGIDIGRGVKSIGKSAFAFCGLTEIDIPDNVTSLGEAAFYRCLNLVKAKIDVPHISDKAFFGCNRLSDLTISDGVVSIGDEAFGSCEDLTELDLPESVTSIGHIAFQACRKLTSIKFPAFVDIGGSAFSLCTALKSISMDSGTIGDSAFSRCNQLASVTLNAVTKIGDGAFSGCDMISDVMLGSKLEGIGVGAFADCVGLTSIEIPLGTKRILKSAFRGCENLSSVSLQMGLTVIGEKAFEYCKKLTNIALPDSVSFVDDYAFFACSALESITLGQGLKTIGRNAFDHCESLTSIVIPDGVTTIGADAFRYCKGLTSIEIPDSVTIIGAEAFEVCSNLQEITLGSGVTSLGKNVFIGTAITEINYRGTKAQWDNIKKEQWTDFIMDNQAPTYLLHCTDGTFEVG